MTAIPDTALDGDKTPTSERKINQKEVRRVVLSSYVGSTIEFYDFLLYATASAVVFPQVFFTDLDPLAGMIASYGTFAAGYLARPLGGMIFGHFGDRVGRKKMLILSMMIMGVVSTLIGLVPSAATIGSWGAVILVGLRFIQGLAIGGEWGGAALMALEHADKKNRGFAASFTNAGAPTGAALGTLVMGLMSAVLSQEAFLSWGWRVPFLLSILLLVVGMIIRLGVSESPIFAEAVKAEEKKPEKPKIPLLSVLQRPRALIVTMLGGSSGFALQVLLSTFSISYATEQGAERANVLYAFAGASLLQVFFVIGAGKISDRFGRKPIIFAGLGLFAVFLPAYFTLLRTGELLIIFLAFTLALALHALIFGPLAAFISEQFGTSARYTGASMGYQFATLLGAGFTPTILAALYAWTNGTSVLPVIAYLIGMVIISAIAIMATPESKDIDLELQSH